MTDEQTSAAGAASTTYYTTEMDEVGTYTYIGKAAVGSGTTSAVWQIKRLDESGDPELKVKWADGDANFNNRWDQRESLTYS